MCPLHSYCGQSVTDSFDDDVSVPEDSFCIECHRWDDTDADSVLNWAPKSPSAIYADSLCRLLSKKNTNAFLYRVNELRTVVWTIFTDGTSNYIMAENILYGKPIDSLTLEYPFNSEWINSPELRQAQKNNVFGCMPTWILENLADLQSTCGPIAILFIDGAPFMKLNEYLWGEFDMMSDECPINRYISRDLLYYPVLLEWAGWRDGIFVDWQCIKNQKNLPEFLREELDRIKNNTR